MRYFVILLLFTFVSVSSIEASSYARSIRVGSFKSKQRAYRAAKELRNFIDHNERLLEIKYELGFSVRVAKSGRHYLTVLIPLTDKKMVQETLDILRTKYPGTYPKKIRYKKSYAKLRKQNTLKRKYIEKKQHIVENYFNEDKQEELKQKVQKTAKRVEEQIEHKQISKKINEMFAKKSSKTKEVEEDKKQNSEDLALEEKIKRKLAQIKREKEAAAKDEFTIFGIGLGFSKDIFSSFSFNFFNDKSKENKEKKLHDFMNGKLTKFNNYMLEIGILVGVLFLLVIIAIYLKYRKKNEDKITIQDIYS